MKFFDLLTTTFKVGTVVVLLAWLSGCGGGSSVSNGVSNGASNGSSSATATALSNTDLQNLMASTNNAAGLAWEALSETQFAANFLNSLSQGSGSNTSLPSNITNQTQLCANGGSYVASWSRAANVDFSASDYVTLNMSNCNTYGTVRQGQMTIRAVSQTSDGTTTTAKYTLDMPGLQVTFTDGASAVFNAVALPTVSTSPTSYTATFSSSTTTTLGTNYSVTVHVAAADTTHLQGTTTYIYQSMQVVQGYANSRQSESVALQASDGTRSFQLTNVEPGRLDISGTSPIFGSPNLVTSVTGYGGVSLTVDSGSGSQAALKATVTGTNSDNSLISTTFAGSYFY